MANYKRYILVKMNVKDERLRHRLISLGFQEGEEIIYKGEAGGNVARVAVADSDIALSLDIFKGFELEAI